MAMLLLLLFFSSLFLLSESTTDPDEVQALEDFYTALDGPNWRANRNWMSGDPCAPIWFGLVCDRSHITSVSLPQNFLRGTIPESFANLTKLREISLNGNRVSGDLPEFFFFYQNLNILNGTNNLFTGSFPLSSDSPYLYTIELTKNKLVGMMSDDFFLGFPNLQIFTASENRLSGPFPSVFGELPFITTLKLNQNSVSGTIPPDLNNCSTLDILELGNNNLGGDLPELDGLSQISILALEGNKLQGQVPEWVCEVPVHTLRENRFRCVDIPKCCSSSGDSTCEPCLHSGFGVAAKITGIIVVVSVVVFLVGGFFVYKRLSEDKELELNRRRRAISSSYVGDEPDGYGLRSSYQRLDDDSFPGRKPISITYDLVH